VDLLRELYQTFGETLTIQATWLNPLPKKNGEPQYCLALSTDFNGVDMQTLKALLQKHKLSITNDKELWLICSAV
jgi:hypothetical protein